MDYRTHAPLAHSWVAHPFRGEGGAALDTLCHADGGWKMRSCSNEKDIQWMQRTLADLKAKIEGSRSAIPHVHAGQASRAAWQYTVDFRPSSRVFTGLTRQSNRSHCHLVMPTGRSDKRITKEVAVDLARPDASQPKEMAITQNVSARGMRVATEDVWLPGEPVLLSSPESGFRTQARVVYCKRMENKRFAVGLELLASLGEWTKAH